MLLHQILGKEKLKPLVEHSCIVCSTNDLLKTFKTSKILMFQHQQWQMKRSLMKNKKRLLNHIKVKKETISLSPLKKE